MVWIVERKASYQGIVLPTKNYRPGFVPRLAKPERWEFSTKAEAKGFAKQVAGRVTIYKLTRIGSAERESKEVGHEENI